MANDLSTSISNVQAIILQGYVGLLRMQFFVFLPSQIFAANLGKRANSVTEHVPFKVLTFVVDACRLLQKCRKVEQNRKLSLFVRSFAQLPILGALLLLHLHLLRKGE